MAHTFLRADFDGRAADKTAVSSAVAQAISDLDTYAGLPSPTNAQTVAIVKRICQIVKVMIRRLVQV